MQDNCDPINLTLTEDLILENTIIVTQHTQLVRQALATLAPCPCCKEMRQIQLIEYMSEPYCWRCRDCGTRYMTSPMFVPKRAK